MKTLRTLELKYILSQIFWDDKSLFPALYTEAWRIYSAQTSTSFFFFFLQKILPKEVNILMNSRKIQHFYIKITKNCQNNKPNINTKFLLPFCKIGWIAEIWSSGLVKFSERLWERTCSKFFHSLMLQRDCIAWYWLNWHVTVQRLTYPTPFFGCAGFIP